VLTFAVGLAIVHAVKKGSQYAKASRGDPWLKGEYMQGKDAAFLEARHTTIAD
jgi:hypothetical protein